MSEPGTGSSRDMEQLSAYLDGELEPRESARLEARLRDDPRLQVELQELRATVQALRALPQVGAPRSFALQPRAIPRRGAYPLLQLGSALATLSFLVVVGVDLLLARAGAATLGSSPELAAPLADAELAAEAPAMAPGLDLAAEATPVEQPTAKAEAEEEYAQALPESSAPTATAEPEGLEYRAGEEAAPTQAPTGTLSPPAAEQAAESSEEDRYAELEATPSLAGELSAGESLPGEPGGFTAGETARPSSRLLRAAEIGLGAAAVIMGVLTVRARRR